MLVYIVSDMKRSRRQVTMTSSEITDKLASWVVGNRDDDGTVKEEECEGGKRAGREVVAAGGREKGRSKVDVCELDGGDMIETGNRLVRSVVTSSRCRRGDDPTFRGRRKTRVTIGAYYNTD